VRQAAWSSPELDARIIDAMIAGDSMPGALLSMAGVDEETVKAHARDLGLSKDFIKKCRLTDSRPSMRKCMRCDAPFLSSGIHNRLCRHCPRR
jgi:hypothetical protein